VSLPWVTCQSGETSYCTITISNRPLVLTAAANIPSSVYNKWHETELERWLSDYNIPYSKPADRKDLENLVKKNWQSKVVAPYSDWDPAQLTSFLRQKGIETKSTAASNKQTLLNQVKEHWFETEEKAEDAWSNVKDWIFDT
jgi:hypothetical protein